MFLSRGNNIVGWLDKNYKSLKDQGLEVTGDIESIDSLSYDKVVVAILDKNIADNIKQQLIGKNISVEKIILINEIINYLSA